MGCISDRLADRVLALDLAALADAGRLVLQFASAIENWRPAPGDCHRNVDRWVERYPGWKAPRGWVVEWVGSGGEITFAAHSVAADGDGNLWEGTKMDGRERTFIPHPGSFDEFLINETTKRWVTVSTT
jgi:hypothetical protein